jgi:hypothetical protein
VPAQAFARDAEKIRTDSGGSSEITDTASSDIERPLHNRISFSPIELKQLQITEFLLFYQSVGQIGFGGVLFCELTLYVRNRIQQCCGVSLVLPTRRTGRVQLTPALERLLVQPDREFELGSVKARCDLPAAGGTELHARSNKSSRVVLPSIQPQQQLVIAVAFARTAGQTYGPA